MCFQRSAFTRELCISDKAVCVCVCVQGVRSQDIASILDIARVIACAGWLGAAQVRARDFDYFPLILFVLCSLCMRMIRLEYLRHAGCIFMTHLLSRQCVSFPAKPLDLCNEVTSRRTSTVLLSSGPTTLASLASGKTSVA